MFELYRLIKIHRKFTSAYLLCDKASLTLRLLLWREWRFDIFMRLADNGERPSVTSLVYVPLSFSCQLQARTIARVLLQQRGRRVPDRSLRLDRVRPHDVPRHDQHRVLQPVERGRQGPGALGLGQGLLQSHVQHGAPVHREDGPRRRPGHHLRVQPRPKRTILRMSTARNSFISTSFDQWPRETDQEVYM